MADTLNNQDLVEKTKMALRIKTTAFDTEIDRLIDAAFQDMNIAGVIIPDSMTAIVETAAITYVAVHFGEPDEYDRLKRSYDEQKAQLSTCSGYTEF